MSNKLVVQSADRLIERELSGVSKNELIANIHTNIHMLEKLDKSVSKAMKAADKAKKSANNARNKSVGFGKKKAAIEELQSAGNDLAEAVQSSAEAQKISFELQTKLAEITKSLFALGVNNIANNRIVIRELEKRLKGASEEELSELAQNELRMVLKQLKEQEDILKKQEYCDEKLKNHDQRLNAQSLIDKLRENQFKDQTEINRKHIEQIVALQKNYDDIREEFQCNLIIIEAQKVKISKFEEEISNLYNTLSHKAEHKMLIITLILATITLLISIIHFIV